MQHIQASLSKIINIVRLISDERHTFWMNCKLIVIVCTLIVAILIATDCLQSVKLDNRQVKLFEASRYIADEMHVCEEQVRRRVEVAISTHKFRLPFALGTLEPHHNSTRAIRQSTLQINVFEQHYLSPDLQVQNGRSLAVLQLGLHRLVPRVVASFESVHLTRQLGHLALIRFINLAVATL